VPALANETQHRANIGILISRIANTIVNLLFCLNYIQRSGKEMACLAHFCYLLLLLNTPSQPSSTGVPLKYWQRSKYIVLGLSCG